MQTPDYIYPVTLQLLDEIVEGRETQEVPVIIRITPHNLQFHLQEKGYGEATRIPYSYPEDEKAILRK